MLILLTLTHFLRYILLVGLLLKLVFIIWAINELIKHDVRGSDSNILTFSIWLRIVLIDAAVEAFFHFAALIFFILLNDFVYFDDSLVLFFNFLMFLILWCFNGVKILVLKVFVGLYLWIMVTHVHLYNQFGDCLSICNIQFFIIVF